MRAIRAALRLLAPGVGVKRWLVLMAVGLLLTGMGLALTRQGEPLDLLAWPAKLIRIASARLPLLAEGGVWTHPIGTVLALAGGVFTLYTLWRLLEAIALTPASRSGPGNEVAFRSAGQAVGAWMGRVLRTRQLSQGPRIVAIGGGTGLSTMLRGLKSHTSNIVAVVTVTDDGGSSGRLVRQLNMPPPGDIRNCLVALADEEGIMTQLLQHRFRGCAPGDGLRDHAVGNLLIAALTEISEGDFQQAVRQASKVLNIRGEVWPATLSRVSLQAEMEDGSILTGETNIAHSRLAIKRIFLDPSDVEAPAEVIEAIEAADAIVIGPGSVFTSVVPNLLVRGIPEALYRTRAVKIYVCNVMTQPGETDGFTASDHVRALSAHLPRPIVDHVIVNTAVPPVELLEKYRQSGAEMVHADVDQIRRLGCRPHRGNFISGTDVVRHDSARLADAVMRLL